MLTQSGTQRIEVIIRKDASGIQGANTKNADQATTEVQQGDGTSRYSQNRRERIIKTNATHILAAGRQIGMLAWQYTVSGKGIQTGDEALQQHYQRSWEVIQDTTGFAANIARGMVFGAWGGPMGVAVGGLIAATTSAASLGVKYSSRRREFNYKVFKENNAIEYRRARANINMTNGRLR